MAKRVSALVLALCLLLGGLNLPARAEGPVLSSLAEVTNYLLYEGTSILTDEIEFSYTAALDDVFSTPDALWDMLYNCGLYDWEQTRYTDQRRVLIDHIEYMPGFKIAKAWEMEILWLLSDEEREIYSIAAQMVEEARMYQQSPYGVLTELHNALVRKVTYMEREENGYWDTAVGALKYGQAECDGYADAFYLLCTLAGFPVGYQYGTTEGADEGETHLWNVVFWDGLWYQADVTWDDMDKEGYPGMTRYRYFNVGSTMLEDHYWNQQYSPFTQALYNNWDIFYYTHNVEIWDDSAYYATLENAADYAVYMQKNYDYPSLHVMVDGRYEDAVYFNEVLQSRGLKGRWTTWTNRMDEYTCFDILFLK